MRWTLACSSGGTPTTWRKTWNSCSVTTPSARAILPASATTAMVKVTPGSLSRSRKKCPATARTSAPTGPPTNRPAAAPLTLPQTDMRTLGRVYCPRIVIQNRRKPTLGFLQGPILTAGVIFHLVALDLADAEIAALGMGVIKARYRGRRPHGIAFGQLHADLGFGIQQLEQSG